MCCIIVILVISEDNIHDKEYTECQNLSEYAKEEVEKPDFNFNFQMTFTTRFVGTAYCLSV